MSFPLQRFYVNRINLCKHCLSSHICKDKALVSPFVVSYRHKGNWKQRHDKREARKQELNTYVGKNATKTRIMYAWGAASSGALGIPSYLKPNLKFKGKQFFISQINRPARVRFFDELKIKPLDIACGNGFTIINAKVENNNVLLVSGNNTDSQLGFQESPSGSGRQFHQLIEPSRLLLPLNHPDSFSVTSMACGRAHSVVAIQDEGVFSLGNNSYGQCGRPIVEDEVYSTNPRVNPIQDLPSDIIQVSCGQDHTLFLSSTGQVFACGLGADGQTGCSHYNNIGNPVELAGDLKGEKVVSIGGKGDCSLAVSDKGDVFCWGNSEYGQLSSVTDFTQVNVPTHLPTGHCGKVVKAVAGGSICALLNDQGQVYVWGFGILGKGPNLESTSVPSLIPEPIFGRNELSPDRTVVDIECGMFHMAALTDNGDVYTWGRNKDGCLGLGEEKNQFFPWRVALPAQAVKIACGLDHVMTVCKSFA